ncbi:MAG: aldolase catalytic domain-containing protein [Lachnospiraceae bacterium]|nr:aldolase catalytic domain-containing protein [Lachnospiraceae bacterium]MDD7628490.1 aldolase catalytic domain-containing protein [Lachnospiraceae bacterium]MDY4120016.1 aldolase catalytic domain-containing protein [Lachnospiraceae bacterium]
MKNAQILDCTLRDGAYLIDKKFGSNVIKGIIKGLMSARIDVIEIGFLQDSGEEEGKTVYRNSIDAEQYIPSSKNNIMFTVLADFSRYSIENLDNYTGHSFDAVRACFFKKERHDVIDFCKSIIEKGYKLFVQPVDILGYTDIEIIELIQEINEVKPYCFSIVDTFGSMYMDDLQRVFSLIDHNLDKDIRIGFHSHNNMQMSSALSQEFLKISQGKRQVIIDGTIAGMGRGAGNTPTELLVQYMVTKLGYNYDVDSLLDVIDGYMNNIRTKCSWGYSTPFFIAGSYSAHVNNINYLLKKNSIKSKDIRMVLDKIGPDERKRYNYGLLEETYVKSIKSGIDDRIDFENLKAVLSKRAVLVMAPGNTAKKVNVIKEYIKRKNAILISVNFIHNQIVADYLYFNNIKRYSYWENCATFKEYPKIITSNIGKKQDCEYEISFERAIKCGWEHMDNSVIMLLRLLDQMDVGSIGIIGFDGYEGERIIKENYVNSDMEVYEENSDFTKVNQEIREMLIDYKFSRTSKCKIEFLAESRFSDIFLN